ncbi:MAG: ribosome silencing factor [Deltaproteobacteria bacterium]|nr:ribosome silencing factor [Deltaproteobacteria bacterium]
MEQKLELYLKILLKRKALDVVTLNISEITSIADYFIICSATSNRQAEAIASLLVSDLKDHKIKPLSVEGGNESGWHLIDYGDVIIHIFYKPVREFYNLEGLWTGAPIVEHQNP